MVTKSLDIKKRNDLKKIGLWDDEWCEPDYDKINRSNKFLEGFDRVILCEDGDIKIYPLILEVEKIPGEDC